MHRRGGWVVLRPRGPRSRPGYSVPVRHHLIDPIRPTRRHIAISPHGDLYAMPSLCGSASATREWFRAFTAAPSRHAVLSDHGESIGCIRPAPSPMTLAFTGLLTVRHSRHPHHPLQVGLPFRGSIGSLALRPVELLASLADPTGVGSSRRRRLLSGFRRVGHPSRRRV